MKRTSSKSFWKKIEAARKQPTLSHHEVVEVFKYIDDGTLSKKDLKDSLDCYEQTRRREDFWQMIAERRKKKANPRTKRAKP